MHCTCTCGKTKLMGVFASLTYQDIEAALPFLEKAFGFSRAETGRDANGSLSHAVMSFGDGMVLVQPDSPDELHGTHLGHGWVYIDVEDIDAHYSRAEAADATMLGAPHDAPGAGIRGYSCRDPEGTLWSFGTTL